MPKSLVMRVSLTVTILLLALSVGAQGVLADCSYVVRSGETLYSIGRRYGVNPYTIAAVNGLANPNFIRIGQVLTIPSSGAWQPATPRGNYYPYQYGATATRRDGGLSYPQSQGGTWSWYGGQWHWVAPYAAQMTSFAAVRREAPVRVGAYSEGQWYNPETTFTPTQPIVEPFQSAFVAGQNMWAMQSMQGPPAQWGPSSHHGR